MDFEPGTVLPVRDGITQGAAKEREMLEAVGGADGIRQRIVLNPDGSTTTLRTRAGQPEFVTRGGGPPPGAPCLRGPFEEEAAQFAKRMWHDPLPDLVSSDGLFRIPRHPLRRIEFKAGEHEPKKLVEMHFASPSIDAQLSNHNPLALPILESAYGDRLWHPRQMARIVDKGLYFCMSRLRKLSLTCRKTNGKVPFVWWLSKESDPDLSGSLPICMNRNALETGLGTRLLHGLSQLKQFSIQVKNRVGAVITASPGGFLGGLDAPPVSGQPEFPAIVGDTGKVINNLSFAHSCGQPWHGWMTDAGIETRADLINFPSGRLVSPPGYVAPVYGDTFYFAIPGLPAVSDAVTSDFAYEGMEYLKDAIFFDSTKRYSPITTTFALGANRWLHYGTASGKVHVLRLETVGAVTRALANLKIHDDGELTVRGIIGPSREIASFSISSPNTWTNPGASPTWSPSVRPPWYRADTTSNLWLSYVSSQQVNLDGAQYWLPLNASPTGDRVMVSHYRTTKPVGALPIPWARPDITSCWEISVQDDLSVATISLVWEIDISDVTIGVVGAYWWEAYISDLDGTEYLGSGTVGGTPVDYYRDRYNSWYRGHRFDPPSRVAFRELLMAGYAKTGGRVLTEAVYSYVFDGVELVQPEQYQGYFYLEWSSIGDAGLTVPQLGSAWGLPDSTGARIDYLGAVLIARQVEHQWFPGFNRLHITDPSFDWTPASYVPPEGPTLPGVVRYSSNVTMLRDLESSDAFRSELVATEAIALAAPFGYVGVGGTASYNPRTKEIRWSPGKLGCV